MVRGQECPSSDGNVRCGSGTDIAAPLINVRYCPESRHWLIYWVVRFVPKADIRRVIRSFVRELLELLDTSNPSSLRDARPCRAVMPRAPSPHGKPVLQTALRPQSVQSAHNLQGRALPDIALKAFAIIADCLYDPVRPIIGEAERLTELSLDTE
jgi:hypothetical protein